MLRYKFVLHPYAFAAGSGPNDCVTAFTTAAVKRLTQEEMAILFSALERQVIHFLDPEDGKKRAEIVSKPRRIFKMKKVKELENCKRD